MPMIALAGKILIAEHLNTGYALVGRLITTGNNLKLLWQKTRLGGRPMQQIKFSLPAKKLLNYCL